MHAYNKYIQHTCYVNNKLITFAYTHMTQCTDNTVDNQPYKNNT